MRRALWAAGLALLSTAGAPGAAGAQPLTTLSEGTLQVPFVTLDEQRLFAASRYGQALLAELESEQAKLAAENRRIEAELAAKERELTDRRAGLAASEFRALADAFNTEVDNHRAAQKAKEQSLYQRHDANRLRFRDVANQVLVEIMAERGALAIIDEQAILLGFREIDITDTAISRLDALIGDGSALPRPAGSDAN